MRDGSRAALRALAMCWAAGLPAIAAAQAACATDPPPVVPASMLTPRTPWSTLATWMANHQVQFTASSGSQLVIPCKNRRTGANCASMQASLISESRTFCLDSTMAQDNSYRFAGVIVTASESPDLAHLGVGGSNQTDSVYLLVHGGQTVAIFRNAGGQVQSIRTNMQKDSGWKFVFHPDTAHHAPQAQWRPDSTQLTRNRPRARPPVHGGGPTDLLPAADDDDALQEDDTSFAWMACASGCCQFHGLPLGGGGVDHPMPDDHPDRDDHPASPRGMRVRKDP